MSSREFVLMSKNNKSMNTIKNLVLLKFNNTNRSNRQRIKIKKRPNIFQDH